MSSTSCQRWAVIGVGRAGRARAEAIQADPNTHLVAVHRGRFAKAFKVPNVSFEQALSMADVVCIDSPSAVHAEQVGQALLAGCHVVVDYPVAGSPTEATALFDLARQQGKCLHVGHIELLTATHQALFEEVRPSGIVAASVRFNSKLDPNKTGPMAMQQVARIHPMTHLGGPVTYIHSIKPHPRSLNAIVSLQGGAEVSLDLRLTTKMKRNTRLEITTRTHDHWLVNHRKLWRNHQHYPVKPTSGLFGQDHAIAVQRIRTGSSGYVSEARIVHALAVAERLVTGQTGSVLPEQ